MMKGMVIIMSIELKAIDKSNWLQCVGLEVEEAQKNFVAPNSFSLAQANYEDNIYPYAIYDKNTMVGFLMYDFDKELGMWGMCRLMIDKQFQKKGFGKDAIAKLLELVKEKHGSVEFYTSVEPENVIATKLYESLGFVKNGKIFYDEIMLTIQL